MTLTIELPPDIEAGLLAQTQGWTFLTMWKIWCAGRY